MDENISLEKLIQISEDMKQIDMKIWEKEKRIECIQHEIDKMNDEIIESRTKIVYFEKDDVEMQKQIEQLEKATETEKNTWKLSELSLINQKAEENRLNDYIKFYKSKYEKLIQDFNEKFILKRERLQSNNKLYKQLQIEEIKLKKVKIECLQVKCAIDKEENIEEQWQIIQKQLFQNEVVKFANFYLTYNKERNLLLELKHAEKEERALMQKYFALQDVVKQHKMDKHRGIGNQKTKFEITDVNMDNLNTINLNYFDIPPPKQLFTSFNTSKTSEFFKKPLFAKPEKTCTITQKDNVKDKPTIKSKAESQITQAAKKIKILDQQILTNNNLISNNDPNEKKINNPNKTIISTQPSTKSDIEKIVEEKIPEKNEQKECDEPNKLSQNTNDIKQISPNSDRTSEAKPPYSSQEHKVTFSKNIIINNTPIENGNNSNIALNDSEIEQNKITTDKKETAPKGKGCLKTPSKKNESENVEQKKSTSAFPNPLNFGLKSYFNPFNFPSFPNADNLNPTQIEDNEENMDFSDDDDTFNPSNTANISNFTINISDGNESSEKIGDSVIY